MAGRDDDADKPEGPQKKNRDLTGSTIGHFLWMFAGSGAESVLKILVLLFLARLLTPGEFGLVGAALTVVALAEITGRIGVAPSIIQIKELTKDHLATGLSATVLMGFAIAGIVFATAEPISRLYRMPELRSFVEIFSILFIIKGAGLVSEAVLQRNLRFREIAIIRLLAYAIGSALVSIAFAIMGFGAWSLVVGQLVQQTITSICYVFLARDSLSFGFKWSTFKSMFRFGFGITLTQLGGYVSQNADYFIVGRYLGAEALGYYTRAYLLLRQGAILIGRMGDQVLFPTLASIQDDKRRLQRALNRALSLVAMTQIPLTALLVVAAPEIVFVLMGPQWEEAIVPFQILIGVLFFRTAYQFVGSILRASGRVFIMAMWQWTYAAGVLVGSYFGQHFGLWGVSIAVSMAVVACHFLGLVLVYKMIGVQTRDSFVRLLVYTSITALMTVALIGAKAGLQILGLTNLSVLVILTAGFFCAYALIFAMVPSLFGEEGRVFREQAVNRLRRTKAKSK